MQITTTRAALPLSSTCARAPVRLCYAVGPDVARDLEHGPDEAQDRALIAMLDFAARLPPESELLAVFNGHPLALITQEGAVTLPPLGAPAPPPDLTSDQREHAARLAATYAAAERAGLLSDSESAYYTAAAYHRDRAEHEHDPEEEERQADALIRSRLPAEPLDLDTVRAFEELFRHAAADGLIVPYSKVIDYADAARRSDRPELLAALGALAEADEDDYTDAIRDGERALTA